MASLLVDGVILSVTVLQTERRRYDTVCHGRSLGPLPKTRALRDGVLLDSEFKLSHYGKQGGMDAIHLVGIPRARKFEGLTDNDRYAVLDECFEHNDHLRANGHLVAEAPVQPPEAAVTRDSRRFTPQRPSHRFFHSLSPQKSNLCDA
jgi:hypothetical protein